MDLFHIDLDLLWLRFLNLVSDISHHPLGYMFRKSPCAAIAQPIVPYSHDLTFSYVYSTLHGYLHLALPQ